MDLKAVLLKRLSFFSQSLSPPYLVFFWFCDTSKVKHSVDGLSESRTVGGESGLHIFVTFHAICLCKRGGDGILVGIVLLSHRLLAASISFLLKETINSVKLNTCFYMFLNQRGKLGDR